MTDDFLKPKNQTLEERKKRERVFIPEVHSAPELMSAAEKLEFAEELLSEVLAPKLEEYDTRAEVLNVEGTEIIIKAHARLGVEAESELQSLVKEECQGVFSLRFA